MDTTLQSQAQKELAERLESTRQYMAEATAGLNDEQAAARPAPDRWSALDTLEHLTIVEARFRGWVEKAVTLDAPLYDKAKETDLITRMGNRANKRQAPEPAHPTRKYKSIAQAMQEFNDARRETLRFVEALGSRLFTLQTTHPFFGDLTAAELMHLMAAHGNRHADQIKETRQQLGV